MDGTERRRSTIADNMESKVIAKKKEEKRMKKTVFMVTLALYNPTKRHFYDYYDRRVYVGEDGHGYIKMYGSYDRLTNYYPSADNYGDKDRITLWVMPY